MTRPLAFLVCALCILLPRAASAKPKVALTQIEGDTSGDLRTAVAQALEGKELTVIGNKEVNRAVTAKLGEVELADATDKDLQAVALQLKADAIVIGTLDQDGAAKSLKLRLFVHDRMIKGFTVSFKDPRSPKFRTLLRDKVASKIASADSEPTDDTPRPISGEVMGPKPGPDPKPTKEPAKEPAKGETGKGESEPTKGEAPVAKPATPRVAAVERPASDQPTERVEASASPRAARSHAANTIPIRLDVGVSLVRRSFGFDTSAAGNPKDTALSPAPGARVAIEAYPLALTDPSSGLAKLGLALAYDRSFGLEAPAMTQKAAVTQSYLAVGLRYRHALNPTERSPTLTVGFGYSKREFSPDTLSDSAAQAEVAKNTPASDVGALDLGATFRYPVAAKIAVGVGVRGMLPLTAGTVQENTSYGQATAYGVAADVGVDILLGKRFAVRIAGELMQTTYSFKGNGALSSVDADATTQEVKGLTDRSLGGSATLGVLY